jgi:hypothetical protein
MITGLVLREWFYNELAAAPSTSIPLCHKIALTLSLTYRIGKVCDEINSGRIWANTAQHVLATVEDLSKCWQNQARNRQRQTSDIRTDWR